MAEELGLKRNDEPAAETAVERPTPPKEAVVMRILPAKPPNTEPASHLSVRRDWNGAIELVKEAADAVRLADERADAAERYSQELTQYYTEQGKIAESKIAGLEKRLEQAEGRAHDAETWLLRLHDAIMTGFADVLPAKR